MLSFRPSNLGYTPFEGFAQGFRAEKVSNRNPHLRHPRKKVRTSMKKLVVSLVAVVGVAFPATAGAATFHGIVVAKQARRHALIVASKSGLVRTVHTHRLATRVGARVTVRARKLADGTFSAKRVSVTGRAHRARIHGVVVRSARGRYLVSAGHSVLAVRTRQSFSLNGDGNEPKTGDVVDVTVDTDDQELDEQDAEEVGHAQKAEVEGSITSITAPTATTAGEIVLQVGKSTIAVVVPAGMQLPALKVGDSVELEVVLSGSTFTLVQSHDEDDDDGDDGDDDSGGGGGGDD
jgi:hypothetical protein